MLNHIHDNNVGLCHVVETTPTLALVIILAGTNDIGQMTNSDKAAGRAIIESIVGLHQQALQCATAAARAPFRTLAVGIPGSAFQERVPVASEMAAYVNDGLETFAASCPASVSYVPFPLPYREDDDRVAVGDERWAPDGLHLTQVGYAALAKELAPLVKQILDDLEQD